MHTALKMTAEAYILEITYIKNVVKFLASRFNLTLNLQSQNVDRTIVNRSIVKS
jgi:hypothetical protein